MDVDITASTLKNSTLKNSNPSNGPFPENNQRPFSGPPFIYEKYLEFLTTVCNNIKFISTNLHRYKSLFNKFTFVIKVYFLEFITSFVKMTSSIIIYLPICVLYGDTYSPHLCFIRGHFGLFIQYSSPYSPNSPFNSF